MTAMDVGVRGNGGGGAMTGVGSLKCCVAAGAHPVTPAGVNT